MKFRNYCIVVMGDTKGVTFEIEKISEMSPNILDAKGIIISTFSSNLTPMELTDFFKWNKRNFLLFDLNNEVSGYHITKENIHNGLFGFLKTNKELEDKSNELSKFVEMSSDTKTNNITFPNKKVFKPAKLKKLSEIDITEMSKTERENLSNKIIDKGIKKGIQNLTEEEKELLQLLAKK